jgi:hypothetical protein
MRSKDQAEQANFEQLEEEQKIARRESQEQESE